jgi:carboxymethylenebutenolidase
MQWEATVLEQTEVTTADGVMPVTVVAPEPASSNGCAVIVIQEAYGVDAHIEEVSERFAHEGWLAVAPHLFYRSGGGTISYDDSEGMFRHLGALSDAGTLDDIDATIALIAGRGISPERVSLVGFCLGGRVSFLVAGERALGATVGFYGGGIVNGRSESRPSLLGLAPKLKTPWLGMFGGEDHTIPGEELDVLEDALAVAPVDTLVVRYPGAGHAFLNDHKSGYAAEASADAWDRTLSWLSRIPS